MIGFKCFSILRRYTHHQAKLPNKTLKTQPLFATPDESVPSGPGPNNVFVWQQKIITHIIYATERGFSIPRVLVVLKRVGQGENTAMNFRRGSSLFQHGGRRADPLSISFISERVPASEVLIQRFRAD